jgi:hypothetical protein
MGVCIPFCNVADACQLPEPWPPIGGSVTPPTPILNIVCPVIPTSVIASTAAPFRITVNGTLFVAGSTQGTFDGTPMPSTVVSAGQLWFEIDPAAYAVGPHTIGVTDGGVVGATTCPFEITTALIRPTLTYVFPDNIGTEDAVRTGLKLTGLNFDATSVVVLDQKDCVTRLVSPTELSFDTYAPASNNTGSGTYNLRVRNGGVPEGYSVNTIPFYVSRNPRLWPGPTGTLTPATIPAGSPGPVSVKVAGYDLNGKTVATVDGVMVPTTGQNGSIMFFDVDPSTVAPGTVMQIGAVTGHQHPEGHDNVVIITPPLTWPLTFT